MKKDTSKLVDLDELFSKKESKPEVLTEAVLENSVITEQTQIKDFPNFDAIVSEWAWRCDKGYPDFNSNADRVKLQEVLDEMGVELPFERIQEAPGTKPASSTVSVTSYPKTLLTELKKLKKLEQFEKFVNTLPGGEVPKVVLKGITEICNTKANVPKLASMFKMYKSLANLGKVNPSEGLGEMLFKIQPKGTGPGEILISWCIEGATVQGGTVSYDIDYNGQHWEVKSLISSKSSAPDPIDPAKYGKINNFKFSREFQLFFESIIDPYYDNKLRDSILTLTDNETVKNKLNQILTVIESIPRTTADKSTLLSASIGEMTPSLFNKFYEGTTLIHKLLPPSVKDTAKASRISVKSNTTDAQYWIEPDDVADITKNAGKDKPISIKVGNKITDENKEAKIWLARLMNNVFIRNPKYFVNTLKSIRDGFGANKEGIIYLTKGKFNISNGMDKFFTSGITRSTYRFSLKDQQKFMDYKYAQEQ